MDDSRKAGELLKEARKGSKKNLEGISQTLFINRETLEKIENCEYKDVKNGTVYMLGFARNFATEVGLDPNEITRMIKRELGISVDRRLMTPNKRSLEGEILDDTYHLEQFEKITNNNPVANKVANYSQKILTLIKMFFNFFNFFNRKSIGKNILHFFKIITLIFIIIIITIFYFNKETTLSYFKVPVNTEFGPENKDKYVVSIQAEKTSWIKVENTLSQEIIFSRLLEQGSVYYAPLEKNLAVSVPQGGLISVYFSRDFIGELGSEDMLTHKIPLEQNAVRLHKSEDGTVE
ncbi:MAG: helix-turn-helix domain-containing protein [Alphaproteobacteria bacterium]|nr:helix-turn-helix domain-containing protein [Alphaproteobacteria bacterium]